MINLEIFIMDKPMNDFIKCCFELDKELLNKDTLTQKEGEFPNQLNIIAETHLN